MKRTPLFTELLVLLALVAFPLCVNAQITGKYGTYYDQRELLFESLPTSENDIIFLGNSITDGGEWGELFDNTNCKNRGISGDITLGVLNRLETVTKGQPAMIFLMIGTNDMDWGFSNDTIAMNVRAIVQRIKEESPRTRIVVQSILPTNDCYGLFTGHTKRWQDVALINEMLKAMAEEEGVTYLDLYRRMADDEGKLSTDYSNDGLHLNGEGYKVWKAAVKDEIGELPQPVRKAKVRVWLNAGAGIGFAETYDNGMAPMSLFGLATGLQTGFTVEWQRYHIQQEMRVPMGLLLLPLEGYDINVQERIEFLYRVHDGKRNQFHIWAGGAGLFDLNVKQIPSLMNASTGGSFFGNLCAVGMVQYDFEYINGGPHNLFSVYGKLTLPLAGLVGRPGYAYMDNYTSDLNSINTILSDYEWFGKAFPGISTDIGIYINLLNGNRIGIFYRWDYLSTGKKGIYRFDDAFHTLNLDFMFKLN